MIHFIWIGDKEKNKYQDTPDMWRNLGYKVREWDEQSVMPLLPEYGLIKYRRIYHSLNADIKKADLARLLVLVALGGTYMDYDIQPHSGKLPIGSCGSLSLVLEHASHATGSPLVANGLIISKLPYNPFLMAFLRKYAEHTEKPVLEYLGPYALTEHLNNWSENHKISILAPKVMLWEDQHGSPPDYVVSRHRNACTWGGDRSKQGWDAV